MRAALGRCYCARMRYAIPLIFLAGAAFADAPVVTGATANKAGDSWRFSVTLSHPDTGWDDYADGWRVEDLQGQVLGLRELAHPHVNEQPFTRSLSGVSVPKGTKIVHIRARSNVDGWSEEVFKLELE
ncbi:hypothetical protein TRP8649_00550 [Pelagimonas phthalicica]|uniref:Uncharacterized protein n=2 Tax=Pelagimonas phthalicica TaxID=1037362 RepID=A0A238J6W6_9RHOB|nr:hypothetical protein CLV87_1522 [Pelagimonas phthalicica]SMX26471.1 hypothetical protein TRP8649_00550 [Pelagimonas phthalicica]